MSFMRWYRQRVVETLRYEGMGAFCLRLLAKGLRPIALVGLVRLYRIDVRQPAVRRRAKAPIEVGLATEADVDQLVALAGRYVSPWEDLPDERRRQIRQTVLERFRRSWRCFVARAGREIVHYNWIAVDWADSLEPELGFFIVPGQGEAFCLDAYTADSWRGQGVHSAVLSEMIAFLHERGYRAAYTNVALDKTSAWKTHERLGWTLSGLMLYVRIRGARRTWAWPLVGTLQPFARRTPGPHCSTEPKKDTGQVGTTIA